MKITIRIPEFHVPGIGGKRLRPGFTLVELLVVILIVVVLATLSFTGYRSTMRKVAMAKSLENMRQLAAGTLMYPQDHNGYIPKGDEGADGGGLGGRGIIWINHIAPDIGYPELETQVLNQTRDGMDQWTYLLARYKNASFVCAGFEKEELAKGKAKTKDAMGGIGFNTRPLKTSVSDGDPPYNANWGSSNRPIALSRITYASSRCMYASSYDWHLHETACRAYNRFGKDKAAMVFWDGSTRVVSKVEYDRAITTPDKH